MLKHIAAVMHPAYRFRSAVTGQYVSRLYALLHPSTTVRERADA